MNNQYGSIFQGLAGRGQMMAINLNATVTLDTGVTLDIKSFATQTAFIVSEGSGGTMYLIEGTFHNADDAVLGLFKKLLIDDREHSIVYYHLVKDFFIAYFKKMENEPVTMTLSGKWKGLFVHLEIENANGMEGAFVSMQVHGKDLMVSLQTHPLVDTLG